MIVGAVMSVNAIITAWLVSIRGADVGTDTRNYIKFFETVAAGYEAQISDPAFLALAKIVSWLGGSSEVFFFSIALISFGGTFYFYVVASCYRENGGDRALIVAIASVAVLPFWYYYAEMQVNIIRGAMAIPFLLLSGLQLYQRRVFRSAFHFALSCSIHSAMAVYLIGAPLVLLRPRNVVLVVFVASLMYSTGLSETLIREVIPGVLLERFLSDRTQYIDLVSESYRAGVRLDFLAFTLTFFIMSASDLKNESRRQIFYIYSVLIVPFMIGGFIPYSDRLLSAAWSLVPLVGTMFVMRWIRPGHAVVTALCLAVSFPLMFYLTTLH